MTVIVGAPPLDARDYAKPTRRILTFDERHFRVIRPIQGGTFTILPADAER